MLQMPLLGKRNNFSTIHKDAVAFANYMQTLLKVNTLLISRLNSLRNGYQLQNDNLANWLMMKQDKSPAIKSFKIKVCNVIIDRATQHLARRFPARPMMSGISWLDPRRFSDIRKL